jgi:hypothetical protein
MKKKKTLLALFITSVIFIPNDANLTEVFYGFPQYLQANYEEGYLVRHPTLIFFTEKHCIVWGTTNRRAIKSWKNKLIR